MHKDSTGAVADTSSFVRRNSRREMPADGHDDRLKPRDSNVSKMEGTEIIRSLFDGFTSITDAAYLSADLDGKLTSWNLGAEKIFGYTKSEILGRPVVLLLPPDRIGEVEAFNRKLERNEIIHDFETRRLHKDGSLIDVSLSCGSVYDAERRPAGFCCILRDITKHKATERRLTETTDRFERIFRYCPDAMTIATFDTLEFLDVNDEFLRITGFSRDEVIGKTSLEIRRWPNPEELYSAIEALDRDGVVHNRSVKYRTKAGDIRMGLLSGAAIEVGGRRCAIGMMRDVSELREAEKALHLTERRLREVVENAPIIVTACDRNGVYTMAEGSGLQALGVDPKSLLGRSISDLTDQPGGFSEAIRRTIENGETSRTMAAYHGFVFDVWRAPLRESDGSIIGAVGVATDVTEQTRAKEELEVRVGQQAAVAELGVTALSGTPVTELMDKAVELLCSGLGVEVSTVLELSPDSAVLKIVATNGYKRETYIGTTIKTGPYSFSGYVLMADEPVISENLDEETRFVMPQSLIEREVKSCIGAAIKAKGRTFGVICGCSLTPRRFAREDIAFIQSLANIIAGAAERERAAKMLQRSEEYFRSLIENSSDVISVVDHDGTLRFASNSCQRMLGYESAAITQSKTADFVHPEDLPRAKRLFRCAVDRHAATVPLAVRVRHRDGSYRLCEVIMTSIADLGGSPAVVINVRDVTERKQAEAAQTLLASIVESSDDAILSMSLDARITSWNSGAEKLYGFSAAEAIGRPTMDACKVEGLDQPIYLQRVKRNQGVQRFEVQCRRADGTLFDASVTLSPMLGGDGKLIGIAAVSRDISEKKRFERDLARARDAALESARLKSAFLANMSHEIRTPINIILGYSELIGEYLADNGDHSQALSLEAVARAGKRLLETISGILDYSKIESGAFTLNPVEIDLGAMVTRQVDDLRVLAAEKGLRFSCNLELPHATVICDEYCLSHALMNLLQNAIKFTQHGAVWLRLYCDSEGRPCLDVSDTGIGINSSFLPYLLEPFSQEDSGFTRRFEGSGLGLALTKRYLELNGATLTVTSTKGQGSTFTICFSASRVAAYRGTHHPSKANDRTHTDDTSVRRSPDRLPLLLVVEDDPDNQAYIRTVLASRYRVVTAASAEEVRQELRFLTNEVALVLMDLSLKGSEDGLSLTRYLRATNSFKMLPIVALTAHAFSEDRDRAFAAGCDEFLTKPVERHTLFATIDKLLSREG